MLTREEMCQLLPHFEDTALANIVADKFRDGAAKLGKSHAAEQEAAFKLRLAAATKRIMISDASEGALRIRLWDHLLSAFEIGPAIPLSTRTANSKSAEIGQRAARFLADSLKPDIDGDALARLPQEAWQRLKGLISSERPDFSAIVIAHASLMVRAIAETAQNGTLPPQAKAVLVAQVRAQLEELPPELRNNAVDHALKSGDRAILGLLATGAPLVGIGIAVKVAGFSAYIMAAQASAIIPFLSGPSAVSTLFVLANPLFIGPALLGGAYLAGRYIKGAHGKGLASGLAVQLTLKGLAAEREGLRVALDDFRQISALDVNALPARRSAKLLTKLSAVRARTGSPLPPTPWVPTGALAKSANDAAGPLHEILFPEKSGNANEAIVVGGFTAGDILYNAVAIDPTVLSAADFSRSEDISNIFDFGVFADRIGSMQAASIAGAENNLRGYVAEQIVAARLVEKGHVVTLPDTANNPGFDLIVDGHEFQVKCLSSIAGLREHFEKYPDMPVLANGELASAVALSAESWADKVFYVEGFDLQMTDFIMNAAVEAGASLGDVDVPYFAVAVSAAKNVHGWWKGAVPLADLPFAVVMDGAIKGSLAAAGGFSGSVLGLLLFGPAGAIVISSVGGSGALLGTNWTRQQLTRLISREWLATLDEATDRFRSVLIEAIQIKIDLLNQKRTQVAEQDNIHGSLFIARLSDDVVALAEHLYELQSEILAQEQPERAKACLQAMTEASVHPWAVKEELSAVMGSLKEQPPMKVALEGLLQDAVQAVTFWGKQRMRGSVD